MGILANMTHTLFLNVIYMQRGPKVTSLVARSSRATFAWCTRAIHVRVTHISYANSARNICVTSAWLNHAPHCEISRHSLQWRSVLISPFRLQTKLIPSMRCAGARRRERGWRDIKCTRFTPDARVTSANPTQMLSAPAAWGARNKGCHFWTPL
jgi:hypothetical protein